MCSGAIILYGIKQIVVGENKTFMGSDDYLRLQCVSVDVLQDKTCIEMMQKFIKENPKLWDEDIGV